ncbi:hypothetical protein [Amycolatopsis sp. H20-H5]|uniref:hypothetical protein n=1 Tax=Amycolatopsis sp. H20-H5 TaxID=3046309 RepID=UPI002DBC2A2B|nr:hypothetical protein [Amycolatopsis sp. H20-H5]MEC3978001.1 hypothetical protein [Amycolatopsis sp. H20-H5]
MEHLDDWSPAGMRGTGSGSVRLVNDEVFVPQHRAVVFGDATFGNRETGLAGSIWKAPARGQSFSLMTAMSVGIARGALERFIERAAGRPVRGTVYKEQLEAPMTHLMLSEVHPKIRSAPLIADTKPRPAEPMSDNDSDYKR